MKAVPSAEAKQLAAENLRHARARAGLTRFRLAIKAGCDPSSIQAAERGYAGLATSLRIAATLGLTPEQLFRRKRSNASAA
jgi:transcriptional regulator with XRE-family HTH domain